MPTSTRTTPGNCLLESLPRLHCKRLLEHFELIELRCEDILSEPGEQLQFVYFPVGGFISLIMPLHGHAGLEVGLVGDEGMVGASCVLGVSVTPLQAIVQGAGSCWRMSAAAFKVELARGAQLREILNRYLYVTLAQIAQTAACTRYHLVEPRLARWLLMTSDRAHADEFGITHSFLSHMLGVRRAGVTLAAGALKKRKLIHYKRSVLTIIDRVGLENAACSCYATNNEGYSQILGNRASTRPPR